MEREIVGDEPGKGRSFLAAAAITVLLGTGVAGAAIWAMKPVPPPVKIFEPPPKIIQLPPEIIREPAPPPKIIIQEKIVEVPAKEKIIGRQVWEGVWRKDKTQVPMFQLKASRGSVTGRYAPTLDTVLPVASGKVTKYGVEVVVDDNTIRLKFRVRVIDENSVRIEGFITDESWMTSLERANRQMRSFNRVNQAPIMRDIIVDNIKLTRQAQSLGVFQRGTED